MIKVSAILPVLSGDSNIVPCVESFAKIGFADGEIEIICAVCADDESVIESLAEYAKNDSRIKIVTEESRGLGALGNAALTRANGEYVFFFNPDFRADGGVVASMYKKSKEDNADICICGGVRNTDNGFDISALPKKTPFSAADAGGLIFTSVSPFLYDKLFKREFLAKNGSAFTSLESCGDFLFVYDAAARADSITLVNGDPIGSVSVCRRESCGNPLDFYTALYSLKETLLKRRVFGNFEKGFADMALCVCFDALDRSADFESFSARALMLRDCGFYKLGILGHSRKYFSKGIKNYDRLIELLEKDPEEIWNKKIKKQNEKRCEKISISDWKRPALPEDNEKIKVSVIIPAYNVEEYIGECIDSVLNNSLKDIEIIVINDGSTDKTAEIIAEYAKKDKRINAKSKENGGLSSARNAGIEAASGEYLLFVDSDDYLEPQAIEYLYCEAKANRLDQLFFCARSFLDGVDAESASNIGNYERNAVYDGVMTGREFFVKMSKNADFKPSACLQIVRRDLLGENGIKFVEGIFYEDNPFTVQCLFFADRVRYDNINLYNRRIRRNSVMTGITGLQSSYGFFNVIKCVKKLAEQNRFDSDGDFYAALLVQLKRTLYLGADSASAASPEDMEKFIMSLDINDAFEYCFSVAAASELRAARERFRLDLKNQKEKAFTDKCYRDCKDKERLGELNYYISKCREYEEKEAMDEKARNEAEKVRKEEEKRRGAFYKTFRGKLVKALGGSYNK